MSGFEVEGYILSGTLVLLFLVKAVKLILEELISVVPIYKKLKTSLRDELPTQLTLTSIDTDCATKCTSPPIGPHQLSLNHDVTVHRFQQIRFRGPGFQRQFAVERIDPEIVMMCS
jgi:hypothetical protein